MSGPTILAFDTSGPYCAVAVYRDGDVIGARHEEMSRGQAERLMPEIEACLTDADVALNDLDAIAVGVGPGNFTGIRISVATARGLSLSLGRPAVGVTLLEAAAFGREDPVLIAHDARGGMVYVQGFNGPSPEEPCLVPITECGPYLRSDLPVVGSAAEALLAPLNRTPEPAVYAPAAAIARIAATRELSTPELPTPFYLREADAAPSRIQPPKILS